MSFLQKHQKKANILIILLLFAILALGIIIYIQYIEMKEHSDQGIKFLPEFYKEYETYTKGI